MGTVRFAANGGWASARAGFQSRLGRSAAEAARGQEPPPPPAVLPAACFVLMLQTTDLSLVDLGRHLKNGEVLLHGSWHEKQAVLHTNFYSYTEGDFPF